MEIEIEVAGDPADAAELIQLLREERGLFVQRRALEPSENDFTSLTVQIEQAGALSVLAGVIRAFLIGRPASRLIARSRGASLEVNTSTSPEGLLALAEGREVAGGGQQVNVVRGHGTVFAAQQGSVHYFAGESKYDAAGCRGQLPEDVARSGSGLGADSSSADRSRQRSSSNSTGDNQQTHTSNPLPVTIYLSDERAHEQVEEAVEELLATTGLTIVRRDEPVLGSWFNRLWAHAGEATPSSAAQDAAYTEMLLQNIGPVLASLQPTKDALLRLGAVLIVKVDWSVTVYQLTVSQRLKLDSQIDLAKSPREIVVALGLQPMQQAQPTASQQPGAKAR
jgi:hypothetical protein